MSATMTISKIAVASVSLAALAGGAFATTLQDLPRGAHPGECYSHVVTPATYRTVREAVPQPPLERWREIPAVYKTVTRQVLVTPGRVDYETVPAVMGTKVRWVEHPGPDRLVETPTVYRWVEKRVQVSRAHLEWRPGHAAKGYGEGYGQGISVRPTGEVMCRVLVPARYEVRRVRVLVTPAKTCIVKGAPTREKIVEPVLVTPEHRVPHPIAPVYRSVTERVLVSPARREKITTPQPPRYVEKRVEVTPAHTGWTRIACKAPVVPAYHPRPAPAPLPPPRPHGGQCHTHTVCEDVPATPAYVPTYAQPRPAELSGAPAPPSYRAPPSAGYGSSSSTN